MSATDSNKMKAAEQARLSELFKLLASRRPTQQSSTNPDASSVKVHGASDRNNDMDATDTDIDPVLKRLSAVVNGERDTLSVPSGTRPRRNTVASILTQTRQDSTTTQTTALPPVAQGDSDTDTDSESGDLEAEAEALAKFPLAAAKKYPFTFKLMIYKLYKKEDWVKTIKEMLEKSKNEFKTLAEKEKELERLQKEREKDVVYAGAKPEDASMPPANKDGGAVRFKLAAPSPGPSGRQRRISGVGPGASYTRQRSLSTTGHGSGAPPNLHISSRPTAAYPRSPFPKSPPPFPSPCASPGISSTTTFPEPGVRVLKKRCVGRRRSMSLIVPSPLGITNENGDAAGQQQPRMSGAWVYNAAVSRSASERPAAANPNSLARYLPDDPPPSPTGGSFNPGGGSMMMMMGARPYAPLGSKNLNISSPTFPSSATIQSKPGGAASTATKAPMMMPLGQVANNKERLVARRRAMTIGSADNCGPIAEERRATKRPFAA